MENKTIKRKIPKIVGIVFGILLVVVTLFGLACGFAWLLQLMWNVVGITMLSIAVPLTFLTALKGVGILYGITILINIIFSAIRSYMQEIQKQAITKILQQFEEKRAQKGDDDLLQHFRMD